MDGRFEDVETDSTDDNTLEQMDTSDPEIRREGRGKGREGKGGRERGRGVDGIKGRGLPLPFWNPEYATANVIRCGQSTHGLQTPGSTGQLPSTTVSFLDRCTELQSWGFQSKSTENGTVRGLDWRWRVTIWFNKIKVQLVRHAIPKRGVVTSRYQF